MANDLPHASVSGDRNERAVQALYLVSRATPADDAAAPRFRAVELPRDVRYLHVEGGGNPGLDKQVGPRAAGIAVEVVDTGSQLALLALQLTRDAGSLRVNGYLAARLSLLRSGDQILIDGHLLYVATYRRPPIALATDDQVGKECTLCRTPVDAGDRVYICPCGWGPVHWQSAVGPKRKQSLECVTLLHECAACKRPLILEERWEHAPGAD